MHKKKGGKKKRREKTKKERKITQQKMKKHKFTPSSTQGLVTLEEKRIHCISGRSRQLMHEEVRKIYLFILLILYPKISAIASGATPIGSARRAPDDIYS
jgi:hypothetical protein